MNRNRISWMLLLATTVLGSSTVHAAPRVTRLTPPSMLFSTGNPTPPVTSRFLSRQRFDLQATVVPDTGNTITRVAFTVNGAPVQRPVSLRPATAAGVPAGAMVATVRAYDQGAAGVHVLGVTATQSDGQTASARGNFEIVRVGANGKGVRNVILFIGDGMGIAHRTAARVMLRGVNQGKARGLLAMDTMPYTGLVMTASLNSIITDSSPGAACYSTGNKGNNNQHGVFPDDTADNFDNPRMESVTEYLHRTRGKSTGIVTTSDVFDATPGSFGSHTQSRAAGTGIVDQFFDDRDLTGLTVLLGGGRKWFLPSNVPGSARTTASDYALPDDLVGGWRASRGAADPSRDLLQAFIEDGFAYAPDATTLNGLNRPKKLLGLFALSNMNVAMDKIDGRRGTSTLVNDYGFPDQPMLDEMTGKALDVLSQDPDGFFLMVEGASIDKQAHNMDSERWILDTIEFDHAIGAGLAFAKRNPGTLVLVTADHECSGANIIGASMVSAGELQSRATGGGAAQLRSGVVGTYEAAGFPSYEIASDGYPVTTNVDRRILIGYAANADRSEDWLTNPRPLRDSQQPFNEQAPLSSYPGTPANRDTAGGFQVTGQVNDAVAAHTGSDIPISAYGPGASLFTGVMDNTDVFFKVMQAVGGGNPE